MAKPEPPHWIERLRELHPLLKAPPPPPTKWAERQAEIDAASDVVAAKRRRQREEAARLHERDYDNDRVTWIAGIAIVIIVAIGVFVTHRLIQESRLEDCLLAHRSNCELLLDR